MSRPSRRGYLVAALLAVASVGVWIVASEPVSSLVRLTGADAPKIHQELEVVWTREDGQLEGETPVVTLTADRTWAVYSHNPGADLDDSWPDEDYTYFFSRPGCRGVAVDGGDIDIQFIGWTYNYYFTRGDRHWQAVYEVQVSEDGRYRLACGWSAKYRNKPARSHVALGAGPATARAVGEARLAFWGGFDWLPWLGLLGALALAVVTRVRRRT